MTDLQQPRRWVRETIGPDAVRPRVGEACAQVEGIPASVLERAVELGVRAIRAAGAAPARRAPRRSTGAGAGEGAPQGASGAPARNAAERSGATSTNSSTGAIGGLSRGRSYGGGYAIELMREPYSERAAPRDVGMLRDLLLTEALGRLHAERALRN